MKTALIPGSFDPITLGHFDIIRRSAQLFDRVVVVIFHNAAKSALFSLEQRLEMIRTAVRELPNVAVDASEEMLADYVAQKQIDVIVKGVRNGTDFDYENNMALINRQLCPRAETMLLPASQAYQHICSSLVRELIRHQKPFIDLLPPALRSFRF